MTSEKCFECEGELTKTCLSCNARAAPDVPELVRYDPDIYRRRDETIICRMVVDEDGEYVLYSQAAEMLAAKDKEIQELKEKLGVVSTERHADAEYIGHLQDELAQIKAQVPVAWSIVFSSHYGVNPETTFKTRERAAAYLSGDISGTVVPLYAEPVDQTAEIERLREALREVHTMIEHDRTGKFKLAKNVINDTLSGKEPS